MTSPAGATRRGVSAALAGAALASAVHALLFPGVVGLDWLATKMILILPGNLVLAAAIGALAVWFRPRSWAPGATFWLGLALGMGALAGGWLAGPRDLLERGRWTVPLATLALLALAFLLAGRLPSPASRLGFRLPAAVLALAAGAVALNLQGGTSAARFDPASRTPLPPEEGGGQVPDGPSVLLISVDTLRADALAEVETPNLDALRRRALWSEAAVACYPGTLPSHVSMFTGTGFLTHGARDNRSRMRRDLPSVAEIFHRAGWRTLGVAANSVLDPVTGIARGFEVFENLAIRREGPLRAAKRIKSNFPHGTWTGQLLPDRAARASVLLLARWAVGSLDDLGTSGGSLVRDTALAYLEDLEAGDRPWFFFLHWMDPHLPYRPDASVAGRLTAGRDLPEKYRSDGEPGGFVAVHHVRDDLWEGRPEARRAVALLHDLYREEVMFVDACVGAVLDRIERCRRPVVVLFTSDHGELFGERDAMLHGETVLEPVLRVPFLLAGPGVEPGRLAVRPRLEDIAPTLLALGGLPVPDGVEGRVLTGEPARRAWASCDRDRLAWYEGDWKLVLRYEDLGSPSLRVEPEALYDLSRDPKEAEDRSGEEPERVKAMLAAALAAARHAAAAASREIGADEEARLQALGYGS